MEFKNKLFIGATGIFLFAFLFGYLTGYATGVLTIMPKNVNITIGMDEGMNETLNWFQNYSITNNCCYPSECSQAKDNPAQCTCEYLVECFQDGVYAEVK